MGHEQSKVKEVIVPLQYGYTLRSGSRAHETVYVAIHDPSGVELVSWEAQEWIDEPVEVVSAIINAASHYVLEATETLRRLNPRSTPMYPSDLLGGATSASVPRKGISVWEVGQTLNPDQPLELRLTRKGEEGLAVDVSLAREEVDVLRQLLNNLIDLKLGEVVQVPPMHSDKGTRGEEEPKIAVFFSGDESSWLPEPWYVTTVPARKDHLVYEGRTYRVLNVFWQLEKHDSVTLQVKGVTSPHGY